MWGAASKHSSYNNIIGLIGSSIGKNRTVASNVTPRNYLSIDPRNYLPMSVSKLAESDPEADLQSALRMQQSMEEWSLFASALPM